MDLILPYILPVSPIIKKTIKKKLKINPTESEMPLVKMLCFTKRATFPVEKLFTDKYFY